MDALFQLAFRLWHLYDPPLPPAPPPERWLPASAHPSFHCATPPAGPGGRPWTSILYVGEDQEPAADLAIQVQAGEGWSARRPGQPGHYSIEVAAGPLSPEGGLLALPPGLTAQALDIWSTGAPCWSEGERVPGR